MFFRSIQYFRFCNQIIKNQHNSINPVNQYVAYGYHFPKQWNQEQIYTHLDASRKKLNHVQVIKNKMGQHSGKVLLKFSTEQALKSCIQRYNQDYITTKEAAHRVVIKPFSLKTNQKIKSYKEKKTKHQVKIKNLDFDITQDEIFRLAKDYGKVAHIDMQIRPNGLNNGIATVYFSKRSEAQDFTYFCNGLLYKQRKLTAQVIEQSKKQDSSKLALFDPKITLESHQYIYKKYLSKSVEVSKDDRILLQSKSRK